MKIRSVSLSNFRKFVGTTSVEGIGDGVSVLVGRNEIGKSTLLQAINGVIFEKAKSTSQHVKSFRHTVNGTVPEVEMSFDFDDMRWTIRKRFGGQAGKAVLTSSDNRRFEDEAAEAELQRLFGFAGGRGSAEPGIWGTLWVQQGHSFGHPDLDEQARRTLQSCLEAQVGAVTGGIRGHRIPEAVEAALGEIMSSRGPRGPFKTSQEQLSGIALGVAALAAKRADLFKHMDELAQLRKELRYRESDWDDDAHRREIAAERDKATAAATKAAEIQAARNALTLAEERALRARAATTERNKLIAGFIKIDGQVAGVEEQLRAAEQARDKAQGSLETHEASLTTLRARGREIGERGRRLERVRSARILRGQIDLYDSTIGKAAALEQEAQEVAKAIGEISATAEAVRRIEDATTALSSAQASVNAVATTVTFDLEAPERVALEGHRLTQPLITRPVIAKTVIAIDGVGTITVAPQITNRDAITRKLEAAHEELSSALETANATDLGAARQSAVQRQMLVARSTDIKRELSELAPGDKATKLVAGIDALRARVAELRGRIQTELGALELSELPQADEVDRLIGKTHDEAERVASAIQIEESALEGPRAVLVQAGTAVQKFSQELATLRGQLDSVEATLAAGRTEMDDERLTQETDRLQDELTRQKAILEAIEKDQGESLDAISARIKRLEGAAKSQLEAVTQLNKDIARLTAFIEANEGAGIEEALEAATVEQARLEAIVKDYEQEAEVLKLLLGTLRTAESEAKTRYLTPVLTRVEPYLKMLLPDSGIVLDENLGISALTRDGGREEFSCLSGGTQEQIAVLTRLAFAELLLSQGRPATVILDDALAFSDDDRIERMFDVLVRAGENVQIIVLTCRKRLFTRLGARALQLRDAAADG